MDEQTWQRFWSKVDKSGDCWLWTAAKASTTGYGVFQLGRGVGTQTAHRLAYIFAHGSVPDGLHIDHVCHNQDESCPGGKTCIHRSCVNPAHLDAVPTAVNSARSSRSVSTINTAKTHCPQGHPYSPENTCLSGGYRYCLACARVKNARQYQQRKMRRTG